MGRFVHKFHWLLDPFRTLVLLTAIGALRFSTSYSARQLREAVARISKVQTTYVGST